MINSKAISLLKSFSKAELKEFGLVVRSPFFTKEKVQHKLFNILKKFHPHFQVDKIEKEKIYLLLYPGREYNDGAMRNIISDFLRLEMEYLRMKGLRNDNFRHELCLLVELMNRNQKVLFMKVKRNIEEILGKSFRNAEFFYNSFLMESKTENMTIISKDRIFFQKGYEKSMPEYFLGYFLIEILYLNTKILNSNMQLSENRYETFLDEEVENFLTGKGKEYFNYSYIKCYYLMFKMMKTGDNKYFHRLKSIVLRSEDIEIPTLRNLFTSLENYASDKINGGNFSYYSELFTILKTMTEKKLYLGSYMHMRHVFYLNNVTIALEAGRMDWAEKFISKYKEEVFSEFRDNSFNLATAILCYWKKDYEKSLIFLSKVTTEDFAFKINIRSLYLKIYYDLNETESFYSHIDALKHYYTKSRDVPKNFRKLLADYVNYSKKLFDFKNGTVPDEFNLVRLKHEITLNRSLLNKTWLLRKVKELENKKSLG